MGRHTVKKTATHAGSHRGGNPKPTTGLIPVIVQGVLWIIAGGVGCLFCTKVSLAFSILFTAMPRRLEPWEGTLIVFAVLALISLLPAPFPRRAKPYLLLPSFLMMPGAFMFLFLAFDAYAVISQTVFAIIMFVVLTLAFVLMTAYRAISLPQTEKNIGIRAEVESE